MPLLPNLTYSEISDETRNDFHDTLGQANKNDPYLLILTVFGWSLGDFPPCLPRFPGQSPQRQILLFLSAGLFKGTCFILIHPTVWQGESI